MDDSDPVPLEARNGRSGEARRPTRRATTDGSAGTPQRRKPSPDARVVDAPVVDAPVVDMFTRRRVSRPGQRAAREAAAVLDGSVAVRPVVLFCYLRGDAEPFPCKWQWGKLTIGAGRPVWHRIRPGGNEQPVTIPGGVRSNELPRRILRAELSAFCPNPRRTLIVPLESPDGPFLMGVRRSNVATLLAAVLPRPRRSESPGGPAARR